MNEAALVGCGLTDDGIFRLESDGNRDGCYEPYVALTRRLREYKFALHTRDCLTKRPAFELHMDVQAGHAGTPCYLLLLETPAVHPANGSIPAYYRRIFTWNDALVDGRRYIKFNFPNQLVVPAADGFAQRDRFCCLIAGNKATTQHDSRELYSERVRVIRWFERVAPADFDLYGIDWDLPPSRAGRLGKAIKRLRRYASHAVGMRPFPSYRGRVPRKRDVLQRTRFSICYENVCDLPGYITEKIFDCFFAGCVPVYWGANNITEHIPAECFVDRRRFSDTAAVYEYLKSIGEDRYLTYQRHIARFLASEAARPFSTEAFLETIVSTIVQDLGSAR